MNGIDKQKCIKCGACVRECLNKVLTMEKGAYPEISRPDLCIECGRCMARCREDALRAANLPLEKFKTIPEEKAVSAQDMEIFLHSKRSCRKYSPLQIRDEELKILLDAAQLAPTAMNSQEKTFIVIKDKAVIERIRKAVIKKSRSFQKTMKVLASAPLKFLFPKDTAAFFRRAANDYQSMLTAYNDGHDHLYYNAPCLVLFTGIAMDLMGKDNALHAMNYFIMLAESMGIGTCINGFSSAWPKLLAKYVKVPKYYKIYGVLTAGYESAPFRRTIYRNGPLVSWI